MSGKQIEQLRKLKDLYEGEIVNDEEYFTKKKGLVDSLLLRVVLNLHECGILTQEEAKVRKLQLLGGSDTSGANEIHCSLGCGRVVVPDAIPCGRCSSAPTRAPKKAAPIKCAEHCGRAVFRKGDICTDCLLKSLPEVDVQPHEEELELEDSCYQDHTSLAARGHTRCPTCATKLVLEVGSSEEEDDWAPKPPSAPKPRMSAFESEDSYSAPGKPQPSPAKHWKPAVTKSSDFVPRKPRVVHMERPVQTEMRCNRCGEVIHGRVMEKDRLPYDRVCYQLVLLDGAQVKIGGLGSHHERHSPNTFKVKPANNPPGLK